jgi:hypothetical protein
MALIEGNFTDIAFGRIFRLVVLAFSDRFIACASGAPLVIR